MRDPKLRARGASAWVLSLGLAVGLMGAWSLQAGPDKGSGHGGGGGEPSAHQGGAPGGGARPGGSPGGGAAPHAGAAPSRPGGSPGARPGGTSASGARPGSFGGGARPGMANGGRPGGAAGRPGGVGGASAGRPGAGAARPGGSSSFGGHAAPGGRQEFARNGSGIQRRADGRVADVHDAGRGMDIHHGLDGSSHSVRSLPGGGRVFAARGGGYVQHPYFFHGQAFGHRTFFDHGRVFDRFYGRYAYRGAFFDVFVAAHFFPFGFYAYAYHPWVAPVVYVGPPVVVVPRPYAYYYAPYPVYPGPAFFLADAVIATSLVAAYNSQQAAAVAGITPVPEGFDAGELLINALIPAAYAEGGATGMSKQVKDQLSAEIQGILRQSEKDAQANAAGQQVDPAGGNIVKLFSDGRPHLLLAGTPVDVVSNSGQECVITAGDVLSVDHVGGDSADARVMAAKNGGKECLLGAAVSVAVSDLQDMYNFMRETVDDKLQDLQKKGGSGGLPATPANAAGAPVNAPFTNGAPPPDADVAKQIAQTNTDAAASEKDVTASVAADSGSSH